MTMRQNELLTSPYPTSPISPIPTNEPFRRRALVILCALLCLSLFVAGCGPEAAAGEDDPESELVRIAQEFVATQDLTAAQNALDAIEVPNPHQFAVLTAEEFVLSAGERDAATVAALVQLVEAMGLDSATIANYANATGLTAAPASGEPLVVAAQPLAPPANVVAAPEQAASAEAAAETAPTEAPAEVPTEVPTEAPSPTPAELPTPTPDTSPKAQILSPMNVRGGPGTDYNVVGGLQAGEAMPIVGKNAAGDWWQIQMGGGLVGWVFGALVEAQGDTNSVAVVTDIPAPPPPPEPEPVAQAAEPEPAPAEEAAPADPQNPHFTLVERRLWSKQENGGCAGQHLLRINVLDANGNRINGVRLQGIYIKEILVTGAQGKGDGIIEYDLHGSGEGFRVINDVDGREATSDSAEGFTTRSMDIDKDTLIAAGYCSNSADCDIFYSSFGCIGHHSWEATFKRNY